MKQIIILLTAVILTSGSFSQNINGKLGTNGQFILRDTTNTFLTLPQNTGYLNLNRSLVLQNTTGSTLGVIFKGTDRFIHNYGSGSTFMGINSGNFTMTGYPNSAFGFESLLSNTTGYTNSAFGYQTLSANTTGNYNSAFGDQSLRYNTTGYQNSAFGDESLLNNSTGHDNSAFGISSLKSNTTGIFNTACGTTSMLSNTTGNTNSAFGYQSLSTNTTGSNNTAIGFGAQVPDGTASNQVRIGNTNVTYAGVQVAWTITSDRRWKSNILNSNLGLSFINKLRPVSYTRNNDESQKTEYGLIAQEVEEVLKNEGVENTGMLTITDEGMYELRYNDLLAPMIKAIQELNTENDKLRTENVELKQMFSEFQQTQSKLIKKIEQIELKDTDVKEIKLGEK